jgi:hypothetical protein
MGLFFEDQDAARKIFTDWRQKVGEADTGEDIRIAVVEGYAPGCQPGYSVHVSADPERIPEHAERAALPIRVHRVNPPPDSPNLPRFKEAFAKHGSYLLAPVFMDGGRPRPELGLAIAKTKIHFRTVANLGPDDIDRACLNPSGEN